MKKATMKIGIILVLAIWLGASVFFYDQHQIEVAYFEVNKYIEYEDFGLLIKQVERYNYEARPINHPDFVYKLHLSRRVGDVLFNLMYFYSMPYETNKDMYDYRINCEVMFDSTKVDSDDLGETIMKRYEVLGADLGLDASSPSLVSAREIQVSSNENVINYSFGGHWKDIYTDGITVVDLVEDIKYELPFDREFTKKSFGFFNRRPSSRSISSTDLVRSFLVDYYKEGSEAWRAYVKEDELPTLSRQALDRFNEFKAKDYYMTYVGDYMNEDHVFSIKTQDIESHEELDLFIRLDGLNWKIIGVE